MTSPPEWPTWDEWLKMLIASAPTPKHADAARKRSHVFESYWKEGYSPDHAWQEEEQTDPGGFYLLGRKGHGTIP